MSEPTPPRSPEPEEPSTPAASVADDQPTTPQGQQPAPGPFPQAPAGPYPQSAWSYPPAETTTQTGWRSSGKRVALVIVGSIVVGLLLFGGGYLTASVVSSIPGISDGRPGNDGPRMGPGGEWPGELDDRAPGPRDDDSNSGSDTDGSTDTSVFPG